MTIQPNINDNPPPDSGDTPDDDFPPAATVEVPTISPRISYASPRHPFVRPIHGRMGGGFNGWGHRGPHF